jgi:hypothetical protein
MEAPVRGIVMNPFSDYHVKLIELAQNMALEGAADQTAFLRRFRTIYRHLAATVDGATMDLGFGPFGPGVMSGMPGMPGMPDVGKLLEKTDNDLGSL